MRTHEVRDFSKRGDALPIPNLIEVQIESYQRFLQKDVEPTKRKNEGLEALLREVFPIESYDGNLRLEYISYDLSEPRYTTDECRALRLTYGMPFRIQVRFVRKDKDEVMEDSIYLGEIPIMIGGGEFIINGAERVHRQPASPLARRRLPRRSAGRRPPAARLPRHPRARLVDRMLGHQEGRAGRPHRPVVARSPRRRSCARWTRSTARPKRSSRSSTPIENVKIEGPPGRRTTPSPRSSTPRAAKSS